MPVELICFLALVATAIILWAFLPQPGLEPHTEPGETTLKEN